MKTLTIPQSHSLATELRVIQEELKPLQEREKELKEVLFKSLKSQKVRSLKLEDGTTYIISERQTLEVVDEEKAEKWLDEYNAWKPDSGKALKILRRELKLPKYFRINKNEYLRIVRPGSKEDEE